MVEELTPGLCSCTRSRICQMVRRVWAPCKTDKMRRRCAVFLYPSARRTTSSCTSEHSRLILLPPLLLSNSSACPGSPERRPAAQHHREFQVSNDKREALYKFPLLFGDQRKRAVRTLAGRPGRRRAGEHNEHAQPHHQNKELPPARQWESDPERGLKRALQSAMEIERVLGVQPERLGIATTAFPVCDYDLLHIRSFVCIEPYSWKESGWHDTQKPRTYCDSRGSCFSQQLSGLSFHNYTPPFLRESHAARQHLVVSPPRCLDPPTPQLPQEQNS